MGDYRADRVFFMCAASLEVKSKAPNGVTFNVKGKSAHEGPIAGSVSCFGSAEEGGLVVWFQVVNGSALFFF